MGQTVRMGRNNGCWRAAVRLCASICCPRVCCPVFDQAGHGTSPGHRSRKGSRAGNAPPGSSCQRIPASSHAPLSNPLQRDRRRASFRCKPGLEGFDCPRTAPLRRATPARLELVETIAERSAGRRRKLDKDAPQMNRMGPADDHAVIEEGGHPSMRDLRWDSRRGSKAGHFHAPPLDLGLEQVEHHVPGRIGEELPREMMPAPLPCPNDRAHQLERDFRPSGDPPGLGAGLLLARSGDEPLESGGEPADLLAQLPQALGRDMLWIFAHDLAPNIPRRTRPAAPP